MNLILMHNSPITGGLLVDLLDCGRAVKVRHCGSISVHIDSTEGDYDVFLRDKESACKVWGDDILVDL